MAVPYVILDTTNALDPEEARQIFELVSGEQSSRTMNPNDLDSAHLQNHLFINYALTFSLIMMFFILIRVRALQTQD